MSLMPTPPVEGSEVGVKTRHVFLDTEVYRRYGHNLSDKVLQTLLNLTKDHVCTLHITDITLSEIRRQLRDQAVEVAQAVNKGNRQLRNWRSARSRSSLSMKVQDDVDAPALAQEAINHFDFSMTVDWQPTKHEALNVAPKTIFESYFRRDPPFDKTDSKEFPDAFVVAALDAWCQQQHQKMYVVTKDKAMLRAVEQTKTLISLPTLEDYLALRVESPVIVDEIERIFASSAWDAVEESVRDQIARLGTVYTGDLQDGEVVYHEVGNGPVELIDYDVISASNEKIEVVTKVRAPVAFDVQYLDTSSASWDSEDKEYIGGETETETLELEVTLSLLVVVDPEDKSISEVDLLTRDVHVQEPYENYK